MAGRATLLAVNRRSLDLLGAVVVAALAAGSACKKDKDRDEGKADPAQGATPATGNKTAGAGAPTGTVKGEGLVAAIDRCWGLIETWDKIALEGCFEENSKIDFVDNLPPQTTTNRGETIMALGVFRNAFPDFKAERAIIAVNGDRSFVMARITGTHKGASLGIPPTGKVTDGWQAQSQRNDPQGRIVSANVYSDQATFLHQLGVLESATAASKEESWGTPVRVVAKDDDTERGNLEVVKRAFDALGKGDVAGAMAMYAPDVVYRYVPEAKVQKGPSEIESSLKAPISISEDWKVSIRDAWAAGDWVIAEITTGGKLARDLPGAAGSKGRVWELSSLELLRLEGKKVKVHWSFGNGLKFAADVGLFDPATLGGE